MRKLTTMREALADPDVLGHALPGDSWLNWRILLIAAVGEPLTDTERMIWRELTGRDHEPDCMVDIWLVIAGRRSGKSRAMAVLGVYLSTLVDWTDTLSVGERGLALLVSPSQRQAQNVLSYAKGIIEASSLLSGTIEGETQSSLTLARGVDLEVQSADWRRARGSTCVLVGLDEAAFLYSGEDSANSDREIVVALKPALATTGGIMMITSSPSAMESIVYDLHKRHAGPQGDSRMLVVQAPTSTLNSKLPRDVIDRAFADDPAAAESEYGGAFRQKVAAFLPRAVVEAAVDKGIGGRCVRIGHRYAAHVDPAGGTGRDSMTLAIAHKLVDPAGREIVIVDALAEITPPFDPDEAVAMFCQILLGQWGIREITVDHYGAAWVPSAFARFGVTATPSPVTTSETYVEALPLFTSRRIRLIDHQRSIDQLCGLRRKVGSAGRDAVDHASNGHDDLAAAICAVARKLSAPEGGCHGWVAFAERELRRLGIDPNRGALTDYDTIRVVRHHGEPEFGFNFPKP